MHNLTHIQTTVVVENDDGDISLSYLCPGALSPQSPSSLTIQTAQSPHASDKDMLSLATCLSDPLRQLVKDNVMSAWDVADILMQADGILHSDSPLGDPFYKQVLQIGVGFVSRITLLRKDRYDSSVCLSPTLPRRHDAHGFQKVAVEEETTDLDKAIADVRDYFRILSFHISDHELLRRFVDSLKGGWWERSKSLDQVLEEAQRGGSRRLSFTRRK